MLYFHIPFCKQKCSYCNFHFSTSLTTKEQMLLAKKKELFLRKEELENKKLSSVYFGGGTPSILSVDEIKGLLDEVLKYFDFDENIEITLEANPDDLNQFFLKELKDTEINRLSIGTQSFFDEDLQLMNRAHTATQAESSIKRAQDFGFENLSIDLIYGSPTSSFEIWKKNLRKTIALQVPHVSSYALTVEPKTALYQWVKKQKIMPPEETNQNEEFHYMVDFLEKNGFNHYEISNFGKSGFHSKHNSAYWNYRPYLGIGPSAHSYDGDKLRSWNKANNIHYLQYLQKNELPKEEEILSLENQYNEMLMIGLRTAQGVDLTQMEQKFDVPIMQKLLETVQSKIQEGIFVIENQHLKIKKEHWFMADGIAADLFLV